MIVSIESTQNTECTGMSTAVDIHFFLTCSSMTPSQFTSFLGTFRAEYNGEGEGKNYTQF